MSVDLANISIFRLLASLHLPHETSSQELIQILTQLISFETLIFSVNFKEKNDSLTRQVSGDFLVY